LECVRLAGALVLPATAASALKSGSKLRALQTLRERRRVVERRFMDRASPHRNGQGLLFWSS
jgi:hypothetical protein